jgi:competence protein ComEA
MSKSALLFAALWLAAAPAWATVDVNTATKEQLEAEGMGTVAAQAIIDYRAKHGPFKSADEVRKVIDEAIATRLSIGISISGPAAATSSSPAQEKAAQAKPAESKPAESKPAEAKTAEPKSAPKDDKELDNVRNRAKKDQDDRKT